MKKTVPVEQAVGMVLPHDITEIVKGRLKGPAFKKGHVVELKDIEHLKRLGKEHIYVLELSEDDIHENEAARRLAAVLAGPGVEYPTEVVEGKISMVAAFDGLLKINTQTLFEFNMLGEVMCATLHDNRVVEKDDQIAATRMIPLIAKRDLIEQAEHIATRGEPVVRVLPLRKANAGLVITGNEVYSGRIEDRFEEVLRDKLADYGGDVGMVRKAPDDPFKIADEIKACLRAGADLIVTTGGMSVDPDDVTRLGIRQAGAVDMVYGTPVIPGAMFLLAKIGEVPVLGMPACGMFHKTTVFDLVLPRILTGEFLTRRDVAALGHGGLCRNCPHCRFPLCDFG